MAEWLVEEGIGEHRAVLLDGGEIAAARIDWPGGLRRGQVEDAVLVARTSGSSRGTARFAGGEEALVDRLPREASEGAALRLEVLRSAILEPKRRKLAQARPTTAPLLPAPTLAQSLRLEGHAVRVVRAFPDCGWNELWDDAWSGTCGFAGGTFHFAPTPAMTVVDIDGTLPPRDLARQAVQPLAAALRRFDVGGNIGIDFPTLEAREDRRAIDLALAEALDDWPHERTAINGFGFVQLVARLVRPSLLQLVQFDPAGASARRLLRQAERVEQPGTLLLSCHPAVRQALHASWLDDLARRSGRLVQLAEDPGLAPEAGFAQAVPA